MHIKVEASPAKIGVANAVTETFLTGNWGISLSFSNEDNTSRYEIVLTLPEAANLSRSLENTTNQITDVLKH